MKYLISNVTIVSAFLKLRIIFIFSLQSTSILFFFSTESNMIGCHSNRYNQYGYLDLTILTEYTEYANSLCEFVLNSIVLDYVVRASIRNYKNLIHNSHSTNPACISLYNINLDTDFISYGQKMRRIW